jgi:integrase
MRAAVPQDVQAAVGKTEVIRSLKTGDYREALRRLPLASAEVDAEFAEARRRSRASPTTSLSEHDARQMVLRWLWRDERQLAEREFEADRSRALPREQVIDENLEVLGHLSDTEDPGTLAAVQGVVRDILRQNNVRLEEGSPKWTGLCDLVHRGLVEQTRRGIDRLRGDHGTTHDPLFRAVDRESTEPEPPIRAVPTLEELVGMFLADPTRDAGAKADDDYRLVLRFLSEFVDPGTPVSHVTRDHCRQVAALLKRFPSNANKRRALRGLRPLQAASEADRLGLPLMSRTTANGYISAMSALFRWAAREGLVERNVAEGLLLPETTHKRDARRPFSTEQLNTILGSEVFGEPRATWDHRQWVFLLGLYAGLRLNEACTLTCDDVVERDGVPVVLVRPDEAGVKKLKSRAARRAVPLHPVLVRLGFLDHVRRRREAGGRALFPDLRPDRRGYYSDAFQKWFGRHLRKVGAAAPRTSFHSTRHCFRDALREAGAPRDVVLALGGWAGGGGTEDLYGGGLRAGTLHRWVGRIEYEGVDLSLLLETHGEECATLAGASS